MRHLKKGRKLGRTAAHRRALLSNLANALIRHKKIVTTDAKAKELRGFIEPLITFAKRGDLHARRQVLRKIKNKECLAILFNDVAPVYKDRNGGYTRLTKLGFRDNDRASVSLVELVDIAAAPTSEKPGKGKKSKSGKGSETVSKDEKK